MTSTHEGTHHTEHLDGAVPADALGITTGALDVAAGVLDVTVGVLGVTSSGRAVWFAFGSGIGSTYESTKMSFCAPSLKLYRSV